MKVTIQVKQNIPSMATSLRVSLQIPTAAHVRMVTPRLKEIFVKPSEAETRRDKGHVVSYNLILK